MEMARTKERDRTRMLTFRTSITFAVMAFIVALTVLLIAIQLRSLRWATQEAASAYMDATSTKVLGRLQGELSTISSLVHVLATSSSVADSNERSETGRAIPLFKAALQELPQMDSIYAGFENGAWLQVRRTSDLTEEQRERLRAPANADITINLIRPTAAADLKLDTFSEFVQAQRPGQHGTVMIFDQAGSIIAHPEFADFVASAMTHPARSQLPNIDEISSGMVASVLRRSYNRDNNEGSIQDETGQGYLFRLTKFALGDRYHGSMLLLAAQDDFVQNVRRLQFDGLVLAIIVGAAFIPIVWMFGSRMSRSLQGITAQARQLQTLAEPELVPVTSYIKEIHELGGTMNLAQRAIWSFAHFVPKEIVRGLIDNSISTRLGGAKQEITLVFTDVKGFTTIAESADPDVLMHQTSRYFSVLTEAFLAEGGTVDKFIGDAVMVFWNAPNPQADHVARACRAALAAKAAGERLNAEFEADGLKPFFTRFGIHVGEAVVGNVGSTERMNYTALGNTVNLAARLEGLNKEFGTTILVSEDVYRRVADLFKFRALNAVVAKGMTKETRVFELTGVSI